MKHTTNFKLTYRQYGKKGFDFMKKTTAIRTNEDKVKTIINNMTLESKGFNDNVFMFECYVDTVVYTVVTVEIFEGIKSSKEATRTFFTDLGEAEHFYCELCEYIRKCSDDGDYKGRATIALIENKLSFNSTVSIEDLNKVSTYADMFDEQIFKYSEIFSKTQLDRKL